MTAQTPDWEALAAAAQRDAARWKTRARRHEGRAQINASLASEHVRGRLTAHGVAGDTAIAILDLVDEIAAKLAPTDDGQQAVRAVTSVIRSAARGLVAPPNVSEEG